MNWVTPSIAGTSLAIAAILGGLTFFSRPRFEIAFQWFAKTDTELRLSFTLSNIGYRAASIPSISVLDEGGESYQEVSIAGQLPLLLRRGESSRFSVGVRTDVAHEPGASLFVGKGRIVATDSRGRAHEFAVPSPYDGPGIHEWAEDPPAPDPAD